MVKQAKSVASLKQLLKQIPTLEELHNLLEHLQTDGHDRGAALTSGAILEGSLKAALQAHLNPALKEEPDYLFQYSAPLGTFSAKIRIGFATDLYGRDFADDLDCVREIRNVFAHSMFPVDFTTAEVAAVCNRLRIVKTLKNANSEMDWVPAPRSQYLMTCTIYAIALFRYSEGQRDDTWMGVLAPDSYKSRIRAEILAERLREHGGEKQ